MGKSSYTPEELREWHRQYYASHKEQYREDNRRATEAKRSAVRSAKDVPCADCGKRYPYYVMDFDHTDPQEKEFTIANKMTGGRGVKSILVEIAKCDVVCSNCHRIRTFNRRQAAIV